MSYSDLRRERTDDTTKSVTKFRLWFNRIIISLIAVAVGGILIYYYFQTVNYFKSPSEYSVSSSEPAGTSLKQNMPVCSGVPVRFALSLNEERIVNENACQVRWNVSMGCVSVSNRMGEILKNRVCNKEDASMVPGGLYSVRAVAGAPVVVRTECIPNTPGNLLERCS